MRAQPDGAGAIFIVYRYRDNRSQITELELSETLRLFLVNTIIWEVVTDGETERNCLDLFN